MIPQSRYDTSGDVAALKNAIQSSGFDCAFHDVASQLPQLKCISPSIPSGTLILQDSGTGASLVRLIRAHLKISRAPGGVTLSLERGELDADFWILGATVPVN